MIGSALLRRLTRERCQIFTAPRRLRDLRDSATVDAWVVRNRPDAVFLAAARVGGILAIVHDPADFLLDNLKIAPGVIAAAHRSGRRELLFLGSGSIYPLAASDPIPESARLIGVLNPANETRALAKIVGIKPCRAYRARYGADFISATPANIHGPGAHLDLTIGRVIPWLIRRAPDATCGKPPEMALRERDGQDGNACTWTTAPKPWCI